MEAITCEVKIKQKKTNIFPSCAGEDEEEKEITIQAKEEHVAWHYKRAYFLPLRHNLEVKGWLFSPIASDDIHIGLLCISEASETLSDAQFTFAKWPSTTWMKRQSRAYEDTDHMLIWSEGGLMLSH